ncbi:MAG: OsmC family peroxiredoxin [Sphingobacteriales bacterium]|nr:MAG: OsmC family peroxiredoxin [Sphingobacteriales bacterium]
MKTHHYKISINWTGNIGTGTSGYTAYNRNHLLSAKNKTENIKLSSDPAFRGDASLFNPEELLVASISSCHMLWYLHLCADAGIIVVDYKDSPEGFMEEGGIAPVKFVKAILHPSVIIKQGGDLQKAIELHHQANAKCFISNSCNFPIEHQPEIIFEAQ